MLPRVLYPALHRCFRKAICLQVWHTPHLELMPTPAASRDLRPCKQESVEKCFSRCQVAKSPGERGCQSALRFLTPLSYPLPQPCAHWDCSKMFPRAFPKPLYCLSAVADDILSYTYLSARGNQRSLYFQLLSKYWPQNNKWVIAHASALELKLCCLKARVGAGNALTLPPP